MRVEIIDSVVVLLAPFGPRIPKISPSFTSSDTPAPPSRPSYDRRRFWSPTPQTPHGRLSSPSDGQRGALARRASAYWHAHADWPRVRRLEHLRARTCGRAKGAGRDPVGLRPIGRGAPSLLKSQQKRVAEKNRFPALRRADRDQRHRRRRQLRMRDVLRASGRQVLEAARNGRGPRSSHPSPS